MLVGSAGFWEGVDIVGDKLSLVIIDKLPFAPPDDPIFRAHNQAICRSFLVHHRHFGHRHLERPEPVRTSLRK